jgi:predicted outer membrane repeat protein
VNNSSGAAAGASLAFNAIGWDMGNIAAAGINSVLGTDLGTTELPLLTQSYLLRSDVNTAGELSVLAQDMMSVDAQITNSADVVAGEAGTGVSVGAAMILASNRVRSDTRSFVDGKKRLESAAQATLTVGGGLTVSATDDASITADVSMSANVASGSGGAISAGGVFSRNDVRSQVLA